MKTIQFIVPIVVALGVVFSAHAYSLEDGFRTPPPDARPQTWYHLMNGNVTKAGITRDFEEMAKLGLGGVQIFDVGCDIPPGDVKFGSPEWFDLLRHAHNEAKRLGLKLGIHNCSGWSCSGGPWVTPADAMKVTMHSETVVTGPVRFSKKLSRIKKDNGFYADIAVLAYPTPEPGATLSNAADKTGRFRKGAGLSFARDEKEFPAAKMIAKDKIIDITAKMARDGTLAWDVPAGKWTIFRLGYICNGRRNRLPSKDGDGLEVDKFSATAFDRHFDAYMGRLCRELGMRAGDVHATGLTNIHVDSWEVGCQNWTHGLEKIFEKRVGYSIIPYLPILAGHVVGSVEESERFCEDFRRLLADLLAENYAGQFAKRCHEYGLVMTAEPYGPSNADDMQNGEVVDVPMSCFWMDGTCGPGKYPCMDNSHYAASLAHVWGRRYVADEAFTSGPPNGGRWLETPFSIKWQNDRAFANGCNMIVYHRFTHQPWTDDKYLPGMTMGRWGMHLDRTQTWWPLVGGWFRYQARCQWMLQEGKFVADALFWSGEAAPKYGWPKTGVPKGYDYDACATKVVESLKVRNGKVVVPGGVEYEILVLPDTDTMSERMVKRVGELVDAGVRVVALRRPVRASGLRGKVGKTASVQQQEYESLVKSTWAKGVMECSPAEALKRFGVEPDFQCEEQDAAWIHRRAESADWYFVACGNKTNLSFEASFRIVGKVPEIWDGETGEIHDAKDWRVEGGRTVVRLDFPPSGSAFVVFRRGTGNGERGTDGRARITAASTTSVQQQEIVGTWTVEFPVDWYTGGTNVKSFTWTALKDWTTDADPDVKYFSGTATYKKSFSFSQAMASSQRLILDLGEVKDFAEVKVNGTSYPPLWRPPFRVDITDAVKTTSVQQQGCIDLEIKVTNRWPNRLIGDETLYPADCEWELRWHGWQKLNEPGIKEIPQWVKEGKPSPTRRHTFTTWKHWTKDDALLPSGLIGPVSIVTALADTTFFANSTIPLPEHPRPDWERTQWVNLNGQWEFGFEKGAYDRKITVPFGWGSALSGVKDEKGKDTGYYRRKVSVPRDWKGKRVFLVVGAADYDTEFSFDGKTLGKHVGGYTPFEFEITDLVKWGEEQTAEFKIWDPDFFTAYNGHYLSGKQGYGNVRGIWQTVYLEARGKDYIDSARFTPSIAKSSVRAELRLAAPASAPLVAEVNLDGKTTKVPFAKGETTKSIDIAVASPKLWYLDNPYLYDVALSLGDDAVKSYFGFREVGTGNNANGDAYVTLNGKPIYLQLCLDQSYHPEGYYTFPTDEYMKNEMMISKKLALSGNRVHIKVEVPRKLYWADKLGLLIQADVPNAWGPVSDAMFTEHWKCFEEMVKRDFNHPSIYQWTLFNETWGLKSQRYGKRSGKYEPETQRRVGEAYRKAKTLDPTRLIDDNSVCLRDHVETDVNTWHRYCPAYEWYSKLERVCTNTYVGSVCNYAKGYAQNGAPMMNAECGNVWGYKGSTGDCDFTWDYHAMINAFRSHLKCGGWLYTEHHDVIIEWNGYVREDRTWKETGLEEIAGMTLANLHGKAALFMQKRRGYETGEVVQPGEKVMIPVGVSFITDEFAGKKLTLIKSAWWFDGAGRKCASAAVPLNRAFVAKSWQCEKLWDVEFIAPGVPACGCVVFDLIADGKRIARNFWSFSTVAPDAAMLKPKASEWSEGTAEVMGGLKLNGFGKGWFEYEIAVPPQGGTFRAELSAKRRNWKDREGIGRQLDYPTGKRTMERSKNPNSYPQTCEHKFPANLTVRVDGKVALERVLPDDPADHRGLLSWLAQPHNKNLREAGSYGWLVEVKIPPEAVKDGKATIRLESDAGLAVYGPRFGRYPLGPFVSVSK